MKRTILFLLLMGIAGTVFAEGNPAYYVFWKGFHADAVNVDGNTYSVKEFKDMCKEKSPRAYEQLRLCIDRRGSAGGSGFFGLWAAIAGYNKFMDSRSTSDSQAVIARQAEGIGFMLLGAVFMINGETARAESRAAQERAIEYYNADTGRAKVSLLLNGESAGFAVSKRF